MLRFEAHQVVASHLPAARWLRWRLTCSMCGHRYPCAQRIDALDELAGRIRSWWSA